jgi:hypothetical protein
MDEDPKSLMAGVPERALLAAVLERAILDATGNVTGHSVYSAKPELRLEATNWLSNWSDPDTETKFTFPWICQELDLCPHRVLAALRPHLGVRQKIKHKGVTYASIVIGTMNLDRTATELEDYY